jgi:hypothetical protein
MAEPLNQQENFNSGQTGENAPVSGAEPITQTGHPQARPANPNFSKIYILPLR